MLETVLANWQYFSPQLASGWVYPDGCRDLVMHQRDGCNPRWTITDLDESARIITHSPNDRLIGFRFHPAAMINEAALLSKVHGYHESELDMEVVIREHSLIDSNVQEILDCLSAEFVTVENAARSIGVSVRTLQRKLVSTTGKSPTFWLSLARVRKASRLLASDQALANIAFECGYSDQAHFTREMKRWFCHPPAQVRNNLPQLSMILESGYGSIN